MTEYNYIVSRGERNSSTGITSDDNTVTETVTLNSRFNISTDYVEIQTFDQEGSFVGRSEGTSQVKEMISSNSANQEGVSTLYLDPLTFAKQLYPNESVRLDYSFLRSLNIPQFVITEKSPDGLELKVRAIDSSVDLSELPQILEIAQEFSDSTYLPKVLLEVSPTEKVLIVNMQVTSGDLLLKLYSPYTASIKTPLRVLVQIADPVTFNVNATPLPREIKQPVLRGPNFNIDLDDQSDVSTEYLDYTELFSQPITGTNKKIFAEMKGSGVDINVDHSEFSNFVHFSSARERIVNFKYKLDLIHSYEANKAGNLNITNTATAVKKVDDKYDKLIKGVISNFDSYERHLYFNSGSTSWPKVQGITPQQNEQSTALPAINWLEGSLASASLYDELNESRLAYTIPEYIRQDDSNNPAELFLDMIGQHFDELWTYANGITDKYDADNRLDYGISKDLLVKTLQNFGVNLYSSNFSTSSLTKLLLGEWYDPDQEQITTFVTATTDPTPDKDLLNETYKRIYHNLPYLLKTKGTGRGLRALINCFGIPSGSIQVREFGGLPTGYEFSPGYSYFAQPEDKIRLENNGVEVPGDTLSEYTSISKPVNDFSQDIHVVEVGFSPSYYIDEYLTAYTLPPSFAEGGTLISNTFAFPKFRIDNYIGDPRNTTKRKHKDLNILRDKLLGSLDMYDVFDFVRLIKFFDNQLFKMIKDFVPARDSVSTGIIIKPHFLNRSKVGGTLPTGIRSEYSASIDTAFITGSAPGALVDYSTTHSQSFTTAIGIVNTESTTGKEKFDGELGGTSIIVSTGELNDENPYKTTNVPYIEYNTTRTIKPALTQVGYVDTYLKTAPANQGLDVRYLEFFNLGGNTYTFLDAKISKSSANGLNLTGTLENITSFKIQGEVFPVDYVESRIGYYYVKLKQVTAPSLLVNSLDDQVEFSGFTDFGFFSSDYNALLGNADKVNTATKLQKVDFGTGMIPTNIDAIRNGTAEKADIQEYLHNSFGMRSGRYLGKQMEGKEYNKYYIGDKSYGNSPVIDHTRAYFAYFNYIESTSPEWGNEIKGKTSLNLRYYIDSEGNVIEPSNDSKGVNLSIVRQTFTEGKVGVFSFDDQTGASSNSKSTEGEQIIFKSGRRIVPIIYSQTSSISEENPDGGATGSIQFIKGNSDTIQALPSIGDYGLLSVAPETDYNYSDNNTAISFDNVVNQGNEVTFTNFEQIELQDTAAGESPKDLGVLIRYRAQIVLKSKLLYTAAKFQWYRDGQPVGNSISLDTSLLPNSPRGGVIEFTTNDIIDTDTLEVRITSISLPFGGNITLEENQNFISVSQNIANGPGIVTRFFGRFPAKPNETNTIFLQPTQGNNFGLNEFYDAKQVDISGSGFTPIENQFTIQPGDEIRFKGTEAYTYRIMEVGQNANNQISMTLDRNIPSGWTNADMDHFVLRRYVDAPNSIIIESDRSTGGTSPGFFMPLYATKGIEDNFDNIIQKLKTDQLI